MQILIYTEKEDYFTVIGLLCDEIHHSIEVKEITECQLANAAVSHNTDLIILDDRVYHTLTFECVEMLEKSQIRIMVLLPTKKNIKKYLALNIIDYYVSPLSWEDIDDRIRDEYRHFLILKKMIVHSKQDKLVVKTSNEIFVLPFNDILYLEKSHKETIIHTYEKVYECHDSLKHLLIKLPQSFMRVHSSYIVNFDNAKSIIDVGNRTYHIAFDSYGDYAVMSRKRSEEILDHTLNHYRMSYIEVDKKG